MKKEFKNKLSQNLHLHFGYFYDQNGKKIKPDEIITWFEKQQLQNKSGDEYSHSKQGWVSVEDSKPTTDSVLLTTSKVCIIGDWNDGGWRTHRSHWEKGEGGVNIFVSAYKKEDITHWMPLPAPPTQDKETDIVEDEQEIWDDFSEQIDDDEETLCYYAGQRVITRENFNYMLSKFTIKRKP